MHLVLEKKKINISTGEQTNFILDHNAVQVNVRVGSHCITLINQQKKIRFSNSIQNHPKITQLYKKLLKIEGCSKTITVNKKLFLKKKYCKLTSINLDKQQVAKR